jgi:endonuclease YncB( thermonuclease family)
MQSKIRRKPVAMRPSRIRRDPVRVPTEAELKAAEVSKREREKWWAFAGVAFFAAGIAAAMVSISVATNTRVDAAAAEREAARFRQCYNSPGGNCVLDGDTIRVELKWVDIAGLDAPEVRGAACVAERDRGIDAAVRLADVLNSGQVAVSRPFSDAYGRVVRRVEVNGKDVAKMMISAQVARQYGGEKRNYCG